MLRSINEIRHYVLEAKDGEIGRCHDFLFDDRHWTIRYMVADTRKWLPGRKVLVSPISLRSPDWQGKRFAVDLTREQVKSSPPLEEDEPVSWQYEGRFFDYHKWPYYWIGPYVWGIYPQPRELYIKRRLARGREWELQQHDTHLRSSKEVGGYYIQAADGEIGHVEDFLVDDQTWTIRYLVVDTRNWLPGRKVLVASDWLDHVSWPDQKVYVDLRLDEVRSSPEYDASAPVDRRYERAIYEYYGATPYWQKKGEEEQSSE